MFSCFAFFLLLLYLLIPIWNQWIQIGKTFSFLLIFAFEYNTKYAFTGWYNSFVPIQFSAPSELGTFGSETWTLIDGYFFLFFNVIERDNEVFIWPVIRTYQFWNGPQTSVSNCFHICFDAILIWTDMFIVTHSIVPFSNQLNELN